MKYFVKPASEVTNEEFESLLKKHELGINIEDFSNFMRERFDGPFLSMDYIEEWIERIKLGYARGAADAQTLKCLIKYNLIGK